MKKDTFSLHSLQEKAIALCSAAALLMLQFTGVFLPARAFAAAPTCNGLTATIYVEDGEIVGGADDGETFSGTLDGTTGNDVIAGTSGNDTINGDEGSDTICGGGGNDTVNGDEGQDWIDGQEGNDTLSGGADTDTLLGGAGDDRLTGEGDTMNGGNGNDFCDDEDDDAGQNCEAESGEVALIIKKNAVPDNSKNFSFVGSGDLGSFSLDDDEDSALSNMKLFSGLDTGSYTVTEASLAGTGWALTDIQCDSEATENLTDRKVTVDLSEGEIVTCTFTNTKTTYQCNDGTDNDNDGLVDLNDSGCANAQDNDESSETEKTQCDDGKDNDRDGKVDEDDTGCWTDPEDADTYNAKDNNESTASTVSCPDAEAPMTFSGVRAGFMAKLKERNPDLYAAIIAKIEMRKEKLAHLCVKHPNIYQKIISRQEAVQLKNVEKREEQAEKRENKANRGEGKSKNHKKGN